LGTGNSGPETTDLLKENSGNRKFRPGNHRSFKRKLWEQEIPTDGLGLL
jgi:hypothetical protein